MMPSLDSAISGLKGSQTMMDVLGNNIANVNTAGFKSSQVNFADLLSQTLQGAGAPSSTGLGGTNPVQIGQGTGVASVDTNFTAGSMQQTGVETNLGIAGNGLFMLSATPTPTGQTGVPQYFTRDGDFNFDANDNLVSNANGMYVMGYMYDATTKALSQTLSNITIPLSSTQVPANATANMTLSGNLNSQLNNGTLLFANGTGSLPFSVANGDPVPATGNWQLSFTPASQFDTFNWTITNATTGATLDGGTVTLNTNGTVQNITPSSTYTGTVGTRTGNNALLASTTITAGTNDTIDLSVNGGPASAITIGPGSYTPAQLVAAVNAGIDNSTLTGQVAAGLNAAGQITFTPTTGSNAVVVSAGAHDASAALGFNAGDAGIGTFTIQMPAVGGSPSAFAIAGGTTTGLTVPNFTAPTQDVVTQAYDSQGNEYSLNLQFTNNGNNQWAWSVKGITDSTGNTYSSTSIGNLTFNSSGALTAGSPVTLSFTGNAKASPISIALNLSGLTQYASASTAAMQTQDGYASGSLESYTIDQTGSITGAFSNGQKQTLAQIALANFPNVNGLLSDGGNNYSVSPNSGAYTAGTAGTGSLGTIKSGSLEASNVDLSQEMSNMIIAQSAFDANSKVITTDDSLMQTLDNMIPV
jgi:flagellar hook protein FlgE